MTGGSPPPSRPAHATFAELGFRPRPATRWLAPKRFVRTESQTLLAEVLGGYTDRRETLAALDGRRAPVVDVDVSDRPEVWIDFVADTADAFAATYAVAWSVALQLLRVLPSTLECASHPSWKMFTKRTPRSIMRRARRQERA